MNIRCLIIDDEPLAREGMTSLVQDVGFLELAGQCSNAMEANSMLAVGKIDLIFLDLQMPKIMGLDFLKSLTVKPMVIITTAYPNFALEGFEQNVLDYLLKPITPERFLKAVNRAKEMLAYKLLSPQDHTPDYFFIKSQHGFEKIVYDEILYIEARQNYCIIYTTHTKFMTLTTMRSLEEQLPAGKFLRIQKSYIAAIDKIRALTGNEVTIETVKIPVSKNYKTDLMAIIDKSLIKK